MKRILLTMSALAIAGAASLSSANAQGVGVQVGPVGVGVGVGPYADGYYGDGYYGDGYRHNWRHDYGYARDCRVIRERVETPSGRTIIKSRRVC